MLRDNIVDIFRQTWPMILICLVVLSSMRVILMIKNKEPFIFYNEMIKLLFIVYILCLFYVVTFGDVSWSSSNFIVFKEMFRYKLGSRLFFKNVIGNMIMFVPYGFFMSYFLKIEKKKIIVFLTIITSITIELTQLKIGRVFDVDDIILNILGGMVGYSLYKFIILIKHKLPNFLKNTTFYNIMMMLLLLGFILYLINVFGVSI